MTQREVKTSFNKQYKHELMTKHKGDKKLWKQCFGVFVDSLCKDSWITQEQYDNIDYPKWMQ